MKAWRYWLWAATLLCLALPPALDAQTAQSQRKFSRPPDLADISYGPHKRNVLDLWKAKADRPTPLVVHIQGIHHPRFGFFLKERMDKLGIECLIRHRDDYTGDPLPQLYRHMVDFFQKAFRTRQTDGGFPAAGVKLE